MRKKITWLINHYPQHLFVRAAKAFENELEKRIPGKYEVEIHTSNSFLKQYKDRFTAEEYEILNVTGPMLKGLENELTEQQLDGRKPAKNHELLNKAWATWFNALKRGIIDFTQAQINLVGTHLDSNFWAVDLPFIFKDHDHVSRALDGEVGEELCRSLNNKTPVRGLAFTYSGGYRIIGSTHKIEKLDDLNNTTFMSLTKPSYVLFSESGIHTTPRFKLSVEDVADVCETGGAIETTYLRFQGKHVLKTNHSVFMTVIMSNDNFFNKLSAEEQNIFTEVSQEVAKLERQWSLQDADAYENQAVSNNISIIDISNNDKERLLENSKKVLNKNTLVRFGINTSLVDKIIKLR